VEVAGAFNVDIDTLVNPRLCKWNQWMPIAVKMSAVFDVIGALEMGGGTVGR
jgi:hypothetical protein